MKPPPPLLDAAAERRELIREVALISFVYFTPFVGSALFSFLPSASTAKDNSTLTWGLWSMLSTLPLFLICYVARLRGMTWQELGLQRPKVLPAIGIVLLALFASWVAMYASWMLTWWTVGENLNFGPTGVGRSTTPLEYALFAASISIVVFFEEFVCRGYLITRLQKLGISAVWAVALPAIGFASYHIYQGAYGAVAALFSGILYGILFWNFRSLWPLVIAHWLYNLWAYSGQS